MSQTAVSQTAIPEPEPEEKKKAAGSDSREYLIFQKTERETWAHIATYSASSAEAAIKSVEDLKEVPYAAVPARNWTVATPKVKVETTISLNFD